MPAISGLCGRGGTMRNAEVPIKWRDGLGVAGREMGPPLWADVFTLKTVNTAVYYPSQTLSAHACDRASSSAAAPPPRRARACYSYAGRVASLRSVRRHQRSQ